MKLRNTLLLVCIVLAATSSAWGGMDPEALIAKAEQLTKNALVLVRCTYTQEIGKRELGGIGVCYSEKGEFLTLIFDASVKKENLSNLRLILPGPEQEEIPAELIGIHPGTGIGFVRATKPHDWQAIRFAEESNLKPGTQVVSAGLIPGNPENKPYFGVANVAAQLRYPTVLAFVTGGNLTGIGSPVLNSEGVAIGIVRTQLNLDYQVVIGGKQSNLTMKGHQEAKFFVPAEEYAYSLKEIPQEGTISRLAWTGILNMAGVDKTQAELLDMDKPGASIDRIIPGTPAAQVGLQTGDVIVGMDGNDLENFAVAESVATRLVQKIRRKKPGDEITLTVMRKGQTRDVKIRLIAMPLRPNEAPRHLNMKLGVLVRQKVPLDEHIKALANPTLPGLPVLYIVPNGPSADAGLRGGDLVTHVNDQPVGVSLETFKQVIDDAYARDPDQSIVLKIRRGDQDEMSISIQPISDSK